MEVMVNFEVRNFGRFVAWQYNLYLLPISFVANNTGWVGDDGAFCSVQALRWSMPNTITTSEIRKNIWPYLSNQ